MARISVKTLVIVRAILASENLNVPLEGISNDFADWRRPLPILSQLLTKKIGFLAKRRMHLVITWEMLELIKRWARFAKKKIVSSKYKLWDDSLLDSYKSRISFKFHCAIMLTEVLVLRSKEILLLLVSSLFLPFFLLLGHYLPYLLNYFHCFPWYFLLLHHYLPHL